MNFPKYIILFVSFLALYSCQKSSLPTYTYQTGKQHQRKALGLISQNMSAAPLDTIKKDTNWPKFEAKLPEMPRATAKESFSGEKLEKHIAATSNMTKKLTFKEKIILKATNRVIEKHVKTSKVLEASTAAPRGFDSLNRNMQIGLILLGVAIVLSVAGLSSLAGLSGLIGLVFLVLGLVNY
jgi:hypothetical protein